MTVRPRLSQRLIKVLNQILGVFETYRQAQQTRDCAHSAQNQPAIERGGDRAAAILNAANALEEFGVDLCDDNSTSYVAMAAEIFCRGMQNQVCAEIEWAL